MDISDQTLKSLLESGRVEPDEETDGRLDAFLQNLPEPEKTVRRKAPKAARRAAAWIAAAACIFVLLLNVNPAIAHAMAEVPVLGELVKVITIRSYFYDDGEHTADIKVPEITEEDESNDVSEINEDIRELTDRLIAEFQERIGDGGYGYVGVDYEIVTDTAEWFTLKLMVSEVAGSGGNICNKYYHIDRATGETIQLSDLFSDSGYVRAISENIKEQMKARMAADDSLVYFLDSPENEEWDFYLIDENQNFYFNENGEMVIVYDKYEVAPGSMGCPEFVVDRSVYERYLK